MSEISLKNINKVYDNGFCAVMDFNLEIEKEEFIIFVGPSGCGKSTTLRMIAGLEEISEGELWIHDKLMNFTEPKERELSMVFQNYALYPNMTVYENIAFSLRVRNVPKKEVDKKVREVAAILGLTELLKNYPKNLSGGQKQRVAIGNAIIREPGILLMDEPLSNLDAKLRGQMRVELANLHKSLKNIIIYVTHDQTEAMTLGTRIVVMNEGKVQQIDTPSNLYNNPINRFVAGFIGSPSMNFTQGTIETKEGTAVQEQLFLHIFDKKIPLQSNLSAVLREKRYVEKQVTVGIRPEDFYDEYRKNKAESLNFTEANKIEITVSHRELLGNEVLLYFEMGQETFVAKADVENPVKIGEKIPLWIQTENLQMFDESTWNNIFYELRRGNHV